VKLAAVIEKGELREKGGAKPAYKRPLNREVVPGAMHLVSRAVRIYLAARPGAVTKVSPP
jgi:hypothetical protein